jgi:hypothetical protein
VLPDPDLVLALRVLQVAQAVLLFELPVVKVFEVALEGFTDQCGPIYAAPFGRRVGYFEELSVQDYSPLQHMRWQGL